MAKFSLEIPVVYIFSWLVGPLPDINSNVNTPRVHQSTAVLGHRCGTGPTTVSIDIAMENHGKPTV